MPKELKIYGIVSAGCLRYVGKTGKTLSLRLQGHQSESRGLGHNRRLEWLRRLEQSPVIVLMERVTLENWQSRERYWISLARDYGCHLVNSNEGGSGVIAHTSAARKKMSLKQRGRVFGPEHRRKLSDANRNRKLSPESVERALLRRGKPRKPLSLKHREKLSVANRGKKHTPESRQKMSIARLQRNRALTVGEYSCTI